MTEHAVSSSSGTGFGGLLAVAFIVLKLTGYVTWSWLWVLSPLWIPLAIWLSVVVVLLCLACIAEALK
jgi:Na+/glutamate symporter